MKNRILWSLSAIVVFFVFLIATMPASQVINRIALPADTKIYGVSGSVWKGNAASVVYHGLSIRSVSWDVDLSALLIGSINLDVEGGNLRESRDIAFKGSLQTHIFSLDTIESDDFLLFLPVERVLSEFRLPVPVNAGGRFRVRVEELSYGPSCHHMMAFGDWLNATVAGTRGPIDFGNYSAQLRCEGDGIGVRVEEPNKLGLSLDGKLDKSFSRFSVEGKFKIDPTLPDEVHQAGAIFGGPNSQGYTEFKL